MHNLKIFLEILASVTLNYIILFIAKIKLVYKSFTTLITKFLNELFYKYFQLLIIKND